MDKSLQKVQAAADKVNAENARQRAELEKGLAEAKKAQEAAADLKDAAMEIAKFNAACDEEARARDQVSFYKTRLDQLDVQPLMSETEYNGHLEAVDQAVKTAAANFIDTAARLMPEIIKARSEYAETVANADAILTKLDAGAHVLQSKYRFREKRYIHEDPVYKEDRNEWRQYAVRYTPRILKLITADEETSKAAIAAWRAAVFTENN